MYQGFCSTKSSSVKLNFLILLHHLWCLEDAKKVPQAYLHRLRRSKGVVIEGCAAVIHQMLEPLRMVNLFGQLVLVDDLAVVVEADVLVSLTSWSSLLSRWSRSFSDLLKIE